MRAEGLVAVAGGAPALVAVLVAGVGYVASVVWLALMLVRVMLWLLRYRRPELAFAWFQLRNSFSVALAELRYGQARQRQLKARARGAHDPALDRAVDEAEREYRTTRYWEQER